VGQQGVGAIGTGVGAGAGPGGGPGGSMVWQENKSTAGWVLGKLVSHLLSAICIYGKWYDWRLRADGG
jgi:hypothetical protein